MAGGVGRSARGGKGYCVARVFCVWRRSFSGESWLGLRGGLSADVIGVLRGRGSCIGKSWLPIRDRLTSYVVRISRGWKSYIW